MKNETIKTYPVRLPALLKAHARPGSVLALLLAALSAEPAQAITNQYYCASLAPTSCEVLGITPAGSYSNSYGMVKIDYCRNQNYGVMVLEIMTQAGSYNYYGVNPAGSTSLDVFNGSSNCSVSVANLRSSTLCSATVASGNSCVAPPTYNILP